MDDPRLKKILPRKDHAEIGFRSAVWGVVGVEGMLLAKLSAGSKQGAKAGWCWIVLEEISHPHLVHLRGQVFQTRRDALNTLGLVLSLPE